MKSQYVDSHCADFHCVESQFVDSHCVDSHYVDSRYADSQYVDSQTMNLKREFPSGNKGLCTAFKVGQKQTTEQFGKAVLVASAAYLHRYISYETIFVLNEYSPSN